MLIVLGHFCLFWMGMTLIEIVLQPEIVCFIGMV